MVPSDNVYNLGNVSLLRPERTREILDRLNGKIYLIRGNHEKSSEHKCCVDRFEWIKDYHFLGLNGGIKIALFHYAMRARDRGHYGSWHLFGHGHGPLKIPKELFALDIGVDSCADSPVSLSQNSEIMANKGWKPQIGKFGGPNPPSLLRSYRGQANFLFTTSRQP